MATNIGKIRNEILTEDEKMEIIADYLENGGGGGSDGVVVSLSDYVDSQTGFITDIDGLTEAITAGKAFYVSTEAAPTWGMLGEGIYNGSINDGVITLSGPPVVRTAADNGGSIVAFSLRFDATTGMPASDPFSGVGFNLPTVTVSQGSTILSLGKLVIHRYDGLENEYDGSDRSAVDVYEPKEIHFQVGVDSPSGESSGDDSTSTIWADFLDYVTSDSDHTVYHGAYDFGFYVSAVWISSPRNEFFGRVNGGQFAYDSDTGTITVIFSLYDEVAAQYKTYKLTCTESSNTDGDGNTLTDCHWERL